MTAAFAPAQIVAERFRVVRLIAAGGMGEVYEAEDLQLGDRVALKTVRLELAAESHAIQRLKREIQLARKITHPNVCRIYDIYTHRFPGNGSGLSVTFMAMEYLEGETLASRIHRQGRFTIIDALPIVKQLIEGLGAAHDAGIVHRDFKSPNVILVESGGLRRAVITDFGLAWTADTSSSTTATGTETLLVGSLAYMAPEQVRGEDVTAAADIYALGVVMFEMVTGLLPFQAETPIAIAAKRLNTAAPSPRTVVPDLDETWTSVILRCLEREPSQRFRSIRGVRRALNGTGVDVRDRGITARSAEPSRRRGIRSALVITGCIVVLAGAGAWWRAEHLPASPAPPADIALEPRTLAVLPFEDLTERTDDAWISNALAEMLTTELASAGTLQMVPTESTARARTEMQLPHDDSFSQDTLERLRRRLGADLVVTGSYAAIEPGPASPIRVDVRVQDTTTGVTLATLAETGTEEQLFDLVKRLGADVRHRLAVAERSSTRSPRGAIP
jgi:TolB-like protein